MKYYIPRLKEIIDACRKEKITEYYFTSRYSYGVWLYSKLKINKYVAEYSCKQKNHIYKYDVVDNNNYLSGKQHINDKNLESLIKIFHNEYINIYFTKEKEININMLSLDNQKLLEITRKKITNLLNQCSQGGDCVDYYQYFIVVIHDQLYLYLTKANGYEVAFIRDNKQSVIISKFLIKNEMILNHLLKKFVFKILTEK